MSRWDAIEVEGTIIGTVRDAVFRVELPNGHRLIAYFARRDRQHFRWLAPGDKVKLTVSPGDLSKGQINPEGREAVKS